MAAKDFSPAREEASWRAHLLQNWDGVRVAHVEATGAGDTPEIGSTLALRAEVELPGLSPADVQVQAAYGRVDDSDSLHDVTTVPMDLEHAEGPLHRFTATIPLERTGAFGYTVRVLPGGPRPPHPSHAQGGPLDGGTCVPCVPFQQATRRGGFPRPAGPLAVH
jgi:starch phosphorylase